MGCGEICQPVRIYRKQLLSYWRGPQLFISVIVSEREDVWILDSSIINRDRFHKLIVINIWVRMLDLLWFIWKCSMFYFISAGFICLTCPARTLESPPVIIVHVFAGFFVCLPVGLGSFFRFALCSRCCLSDWLAVLSNSQAFGCESEWDQYIIDWICSSWCFCFWVSF